MAQLPINEPDRRGATKAAKSKNPSGRERSNAQKRDTSQDEGRSR